MGSLGGWTWAAASWLFLCFRVNFKHCIYLPYLILFQFIWYHYHVIYLHMFCICLHLSSFEVLPCCKYSIRPRLNCLRWQKDLISGYDRIERSNRVEQACNRCGTEWGPWICFCSSSCGALLVAALPFCRPVQTFLTRGGLDIIAFNAALMACKGFSIERVCGKRSTAQVFHSASSFHEAPFLVVGCLCEIRNQWPMISMAEFLVAPGRSMFQGHVGKDRTVPPFQNDFPLYTEYTCGLQTQLLISVIVWLKDQGIQPW